MKVLKNNKYSLAKEILVKDYSKSVKFNKLPVVDSEVDALLVELIVLSSVSVCFCLSGRPPWRESGCPYRDSASRPGLAWLVTPPTRSCLG